MAQVPMIYQVPIILGYKEVTYCMFIKFLLWPSQHLEETYGNNDITYWGMWATQELYRLQVKTVYFETGRSDIVNLRWYICS
jgi:hypothetical protein